MLKKREFYQAREKRENESFEEYFEKMNWQIDENYKIFDHNIKVADRLFYLGFLCWIFFIVFIFLLESYF